MVKFLEALTMPNVEINADATVPSPNTIVQTNIFPANWRPEDLCISNEETLEDLLRRFVSPEVDYTLERQEGACHFGCGSRYATGLSTTDPWSRTNTSTTMEPL
ncbi:hypothetical protein N657DRAFT_645177 [Parathielavia appendiculata]|uniref:Uncharacterized protein n=1 Tax=Parathielavia appendiculata TaxID=2587402 RepID=A0AAN6Z4A7_9PEZI|nr:hypothetical protein N657DRAFT_645177 [Parathielavia appendiculata]